MVFGTGCAFWRASISDLDFVSNAARDAVSYMTQPYAGMDPSLSCMLYLAAYLFFTVFPDVDSNKSIVGRHIKFPGPHRGITHSIWIPSILFALGLINPLVMWCALGYIVHLILDSMSKCGIAWFYPFGGYVVYESGAKIARGHKHYTYASSGRESTLFCTIVVLIFVGLGFACLYLP